MKFIDLTERCINKRIDGFTVSQDLRRSAALSLSLNGSTYRVNSNLIATCASASFTGNKPKRPRDDSKREYKHIARITSRGCHARYLPKIAIERPRLRPRVKAHSRHASQVPARRDAILIISPAERRTFLAAAQARRFLHRVATPRTRRRGRKSEESR